MEKARSMLKASELLKKFWANAIVTASYISNISPTYAIWQKGVFGVKPKVSHLRVFRCVALVHMPMQKLDDRAVMGIFIGSCTEGKAYKIYIPESEKVLISRDVKFIESENWQWQVVKEISPNTIVLKERRIDTST